MTIDVPKIKKLLALSASDNDGEALNSIRAANAILKKNQLSWYEFIDSLTTVTFVPMPAYEAPRPASPRSAKIEEMLQACLDNVKGPAWEFIDSLAKSYDEWGKLTQRQYAALKKFYDRIDA